MNDETSEDQRWFVVWDRLSWFLWTIIGGLYAIFSPFEATTWKWWLLLFMMVAVLSVIEITINLYHECRKLSITFFQGVVLSFSRPAVVIADAGAIGHRKFWTWADAEEWSVLHRSLYDFTSIPMHSHEVLEYEDWLQEVLWPKGKEWD